MKITVMFKDPDTVRQEIEIAAKASLRDLGLEDDELEPLIERRSEKLAEILSRWVEYGEYITIEFDTDAKTATVMPVKG